MVEERRPLFLVSVGKSIKKHNIMWVKRALTFHRPMDTGVLEHIKHVPWCWESNLKYETEEYMKSEFFQCLWLRYLKSKFYFSTKFKNSPMRRLIYEMEENARCMKISYKDTL